MEKTIDINEVVRVETMPVIFQQLELVGEYIEEELNQVKNCECTEENKQEVKKIRTNINKILEEFEKKRKEIKNQCLEAYNQFEDKYEIEVKNKLQNASEELKQKIDEIEKLQLKQKNIELKDFINEYIINNHLENILDVEKVISYGNLKVNLSTTIKSLKENSKNFIERIANEIKLIELEDTPSDLIYEYINNGYDLTKAKLKLLERKKEIEELAKKRENVQEILVEEDKIEKQIEEIVKVPKEIQQEEELLICTFTIKTTKDKIINLKEYLKKEKIMIINNEEE